MTDGFTILVPVFNEQDNLLRLETELNTFIKTTNLYTRVLFIDDGSTDNSLEIIEGICRGNDAFHYISFSKNNGLSAALKAGFDHVDTTLLGYIDADLQTSPMDFNLLLPYAKEFNLVTGIRTDRHDSIIKSLSSKIANAIRRAFTKDGMEDTGCPLKVIQTENAKQIYMFRGLHRFLAAMILLQKGSVKQVPVTHYPRIAGRSKFGLRNRLVSPLLDCFAYLWMKKRYINYTITKTDL